MGLPDFNQSLLPVLTRAFAEFADEPCCAFRNDARTEAYSYREVGDLSARIANKLIATGFRPGMKGAVYSLNSALSFIATLGIVRAGGTWIPINPRNSERDNVAILQKFGADTLFFQTAFRQPIIDFVGSETSTESIPATRLVCIDGDASLVPAVVGQPAECSFDDWLDGVDHQPPDIDVAPTDLVTIPQTGGTTGLPKGVMLSHRNFCALEYATRLMYGARRPAVLCAAPMTHVGGRIAICGLSSGARFEILEAVEPQKILQTIQDTKITDTFLPPTGVYALLDQPNLASFDLSSLVSFSYGSAPISILRLKEALRRIGPVMRGGFGQTECPMFIARLHPEEHFLDSDPRAGLASDQRLKSVGRATVISQLGIFDDKGGELPAGERGEIAVKGPMVSEGYYKDPEETAKIRVNGWHLTGDIGYLDDQGYLYIVDRKKDMIISGGFNVYSSEVEQALMEIPGVKLAAVFGLPHDHWGEIVSAHVQLDDGSALRDIDIVVEAKRAIGSVKAPKQVKLVSDFPRTPVGKIDKKEMRRLAALHW